jgi:hypothetical protein
MVEVVTSTTFLTTTKTKTTLLHHARKRLLLHVGRMHLPKAKTDKEYSRMAGTRRERSSPTLTARPRKDVSSIRLHHQSEPNLHIVLARPASKLLQGPNGQHQPHLYQLQDSSSAPHHLQ